MNEPTPIATTLENKVEKLKNNQLHEDEKTGVKKNGGARPGAGRKPGGFNSTTLEALKIKKGVDQLIMRGATKLFNAQFNLALGEQSLYVKYHVGKGKERKTVVEVVSDPEIIKEYIIDDGLTLNQQGDDEYYYISTKPANNMAIDSLFNRALGRAPDRLEIIGGFFEKKELTIKVINETPAQEPDLPSVSPGPELISPAEPSA